MGLQMLRRQARQAKANQSEIGQEEQNGRDLDRQRWRQNQSQPKAYGADEKSNDERLMAAIAAAFHIGRGHGRHLSVGTVTF
ncbi:hypothetical protein D3C72_1817640 [compost metagenome]